MERPIQRKMTWFRIKPKSKGLLDCKSNCSAGRDCKICHTGYILFPRILLNQPYLLMQLRLFFQVARSFKASINFMTESAVGVEFLNLKQSSVFINITSR